MDEAQVKRVMAIVIFGERICPLLGEPRKGLGSNAVGDGEGQGFVGGGSWIL